MEDLGLFVYGIIVVAALIFTVVLIAAPLKLYAIHRELKAQTQLLARIEAGPARVEIPTPERFIKPPDPPPTREELDRRFREWQRKG